MRNDGQRRHCLQRVVTAATGRIEKGKCMGCDKDNDKDDKKKKSKGKGKGK